jgi:hypothetical protein
MHPLEQHLNDADGTPFEFTESNIVDMRETMTTMYGRNYILLINSMRTSDIVRRANGEDNNAPKCVSRHKGDDDNDVWTKLYNNQLDED